jgi:NHL repeat.
VLYIADSGNKRVRRVYQGVITTVGDPGRTGGAALPLNAPTGVAVDGLDNLYVADGRTTTLKLTAAGTISALQTGGVDLALDAAGNLYSAGINGIRRLAGGVATQLVPPGAGLFGGDGGPATDGRLNTPAGIVLDVAGALYIADTKNHRIRKVSATGILTTVSAAVANPGYLALDSRGVLYASDGPANRIYRINSDGSAAVFAGADKAGFPADEGPAAMSLLSAPAAIAFDALNNLYFADSGSGRIRRIPPEG